MQTKCCIACLKQKPLTAFYAEKLGKFGRRSRCKECYNAYVSSLRDANLDQYKARESAANKRWRKRNPEIAKEISRSNQRRHVAELRAEVRSKLGGKCKKCGLKEQNLLHIDHKDDSGYADKLTFNGNKTAYLSHVLNNPGNYQLLCPNCNHKKRLRPQRTTASYEQKLRKAALAVLGDQCAECDEDDQAVLCIDHCHAGGRRERRKIGGSNAMYRKIIKNAAGHKLLCHNCNWRKRHRGREY